MQIGRLGFRRLTKIAPPPGAAGRRSMPSRRIVRPLSQVPLRKWPRQP